MNRKIKFKRLFQHEETGRICEIMWGNIDSNDEPYEHFEGFKSPAHISGYTVVADRQFTGLKDKNGREMYEGDIYKRKLDKAGRFRDSGSENWCDYWLIHWIDKHACFTTTCIADYDPNTGKMIKKRSNENPYSKRFDEMDEYIGNIYENPELLND